MEKQQLRFKTTYLLGTLIVDQMMEHKRNAIQPNGILVSILDQQRLDVMDSAGWDSKVFLIHRTQLELFGRFLADVNDYLANNVSFARTELNTPHGLDLIKSLLDLQALRSKLEFAKDFPEMEVD